MADDDTTLVEGYDLERVLKLVDVNFEDRIRATLDKLFGVSTEYSRFELDACGNISGARRFVQSLPIIQELNAACLTRIEQFIKRSKKVKKDLQGISNNQLKHSSIANDYDFCNFINGIISDLASEQAETDFRAVIERVKALQNESEVQAQDCLT